MDWELQAKSIKENRFTAIKTAKRFFIDLKMLNNIAQKPFLSFQR